MRPPLPSSVRLASSVSSVAVLKWDTSIVIGIKFATFLTVHRLKVTKDESLSVFRNKEPS